MLDLVTPLSFMVRSMALPWGNCLQNVWFILWRHLKLERFVSSCGPLYHISFYFPEISFPVVSLNVTLLYCVFVNCNHKTNMGDSLKEKTDPPRVACLFKEGDSNRFG